MTEHEHGKYVWKRNIIGLRIPDPLVLDTESFVNYVNEESAPAPSGLQREVVQLCNYENEQKLKRNTEVFKNHKPIGCTAILSSAQTYIKCSKLLEMF